MYRELIQHAQMLHFPIYALIVFVAVFATLVARVLLRNDFAAVSSLPLEDDEEVRRDR